MAEKVWCPGSEKGKKKEKKHMWLGELPAVNEVKVGGTEVYTAATSIKNKTATERDRTTGGGLTQK